MPVPAGAAAAAFVTLACLMGSASSLAGFKAVQPATPNTCYYVSTAPVFPYPSQVNDTLGFPESTIHAYCGKYHLEMAHFNDASDVDAVSNTAICYVPGFTNSSLNFYPKTGSHMPAAVSTADHQCAFVNPIDRKGYEEDPKAATGSVSCISDQSSADKLKTPPHYICRKNAECERVSPHCTDHPDSKKCIIKQDSGKHVDVVKMCNRIGGKLPTVTGIKDAGFLKTLYTAASNEPIWLNFGFKNIPIDCVMGGLMPNGSQVEDCLKKELLFKDILKGDVPLSASITSFGVDWVIALRNSSCFTLAWDAALDKAYINDTDCAGTAMAICELNKDVVPAETPDYHHNQLVCPSVSGGLLASRNLAVSSHAPQGAFCVGTKFPVECNTTDPGFNQFMNHTLGNTTEMECMFDYQWEDLDPQYNCSTKAYCAPPTPVNLMTTDYDDANGTFPLVEQTTVITYSCVSGRKLLHVMDLANQSTSALMDTKTVTCQEATGLYEPDITNYTCTPSCHIPAMDPAVYQNNWPNPFYDPQYDQTVEFACKEVGHKLVTWTDFAAVNAAGIEAGNLTSKCMINGSLTPSISDYTCTKDCGKPGLNPDAMVYDWNSTVGTKIGVKINYTCKNAGKTIVHKLTKVVHDNLTLTCRFDGNYDHNIDEYDCTQCFQPTNPPNGKFNCKSETYAVGTSCNLQCNAFHVSTKDSEITCVTAPDGSEQWNRDLTNDFECSTFVGLVVGGVKPDKHYSKAVEVFAPGKACHGALGTPLPIPTTGASVAYMKGVPVVCGGAREEYGACKVAKSGLRTCGHDATCVETAGGAKWCHGPKTNQCYWLDRTTIPMTWKQDFHLDRPRAFAATVMLPDGRLWILGGLGDAGEVHGSTVFVKYDRELKTFSTTMGPNMMLGRRFGHCAVLLPDQKSVLITGGHDDKDYVTKGEIYDLETHMWTVKSYLMPSSGPRIDHSCAVMEIRGNPFAIVVGGSNHNGTIRKAELFDHNYKIWNEVGKADLPELVRSSAIIETATGPAIVAGSRCTYDASLMRETCERSSRVLEYVRHPTLGMEHDYWQNMTLHDLKGGARSGHRIMTVKNDYFGSCP